MQIHTLFIYFIVSTIHTCSQYIYRTINLKLFLYSTPFKISQYMRIDIRIFDVCNRWSGTKVIILGSRELTRYGCVW